METLVLREERPSFNYLNDFGGFWKPGYKRGLFSIFIAEIFTSRIRFFDYIFQIYDAGSPL